MKKNFSISNVLQGSLTKGEDIIDGLTDVLNKHNLSSGIISGIGAVSEARIGYFNSKTKQYEERHFKEQLEVLSLLGNVSMKDGAIFPHLHIMLSRDDFSVIGGHLYKGTIVYALEYQIIILSGDGFIRGFDEDTGLFLWKR